MNQRTRTVSSLRPITRAELELIFERGYNTSSRQALAATWGVENLDTRTADLVEDAMEEEERALELIGALEGKERLILDMMVMLGGRARGEQLRKELLLRGQEDCSDSMSALIAKHAVVILAPSSHSELDIELTVQNQSFLQYELALSAAVCRELDGEQDMTGKLAQWSEEVSSEQSESQQSLELNLLHLMSNLSRTPLRLNKSGVPNKRIALKLIDGLIRPASSHLPEPWLSLDSSGQDYFAFLLGMSTQLGFTRIEQEAVLVDTESVREFFSLEQGTRLHRLLDAIQKVRGWNEWVSSLSESPSLDEDIVELQLSQYVENGADLIGARGYLISVIRRARLDGWVSLQSFVTLCKKLDRDYLPRIVERFAHHEASEDEVERYVCAFIEHALFWTGFVKLGRGPLGERLMALSKHGEDVLGQRDPDAESQPEPRSQKGSLIVQPNYEIMVFLDAVTTPTLAFLYDMSERIALANRMVTFKLDASSLQRGYSMGLTAEQVIEELNACSMTPLASSVEFQIKDWERVWGRLVLWAQGILLRHEDPDRLDDVLSEIRYSRRKDPIQVERIAGGAAFLNGQPDEAMVKILSRHLDVEIDYLGVRPPCLSIEGPLTFSYNPMTCDMVTLRELDHIAEEVKDECTPRKRVVKLQESKLLKRWPNQTVAQTIAFLERALIGGCPPDQVLRLRSLFDLQDRLEVRHNLVMFELDSDLADLIMSSSIVQDMFIKRYNPEAIAVDAEHAEDLLAWLREVGVGIDE